MTVQEHPARGMATRMVVRATAVASVLTVLGSLLGLVRDLALARFFGATGQTDAFLVAWTVPDTASPLLIEGAMTILLVPIFVRALASAGGFTAVVRATLPRLTVLLALAAGTVALAAPLLVHLLAPGLADPGTAIRCTRVTAVTVLTFGLAGYLGAALRAGHVFGWPAAIYVAYNVGIVSCIALLHVPLGVFSAAVGVAIGSVLMVAVQLAPFLRRLAPRTPSAPAAVIRPSVALLAFVPIGVFTLTRHAQVFIERILGSELSAGTISHLNYAQKVAQVPMMLSVMVATVTFPMLARSVADGDEAGTRRRSAWDLRVVSGVVLVASAYLVAFAAPILRLLFEHGAFTARDTSATAGIMRVYALGLLGQAVVVVLCRSYFSDPRPAWYPTLVMGLGLAATAVVSIAFLQRWQGMAIAAGNAAGITLTAGLMLTGPRRGTSPVAVPAAVRGVARLALLAAVAGLAGALVGRLMVGLPTVAVLTVGGLVLLGVFGLLGALTGGRGRHVLAGRPARLPGAARPAGPAGTPGDPPVPYVLMYHSVSGGAPDPYRIAVSPRRFGTQMRWLARRGLRGVSVRELLDAERTGRAAGLVGLTFDDGYADFVTHALPVLARHGFTATVYVVADRLGGHNDWEADGPLRPLLTADEVREVARQGMEIGSHGLGHLRLAGADPQTLHGEIVGSREHLEWLLDAPVRGFCYPYGELSDAALDAVRDAGYDYAVATWASGRRDRHALPRTYVGATDGTARLFAKRLRHRLAWGAGR
jgi:putative peptidoglycan lipid II flippase